MATPSPDVPYVLGDTGAEHERLIRQAAIFDPFTERLFRDAGIGPGQRVLDVGSGVGDVAMLAARLVGPTGTVVGVERDAGTLTKARERVAEAGLDNVTFVETDVAHARWRRALRCGRRTPHPGVPPRSRRGRALALHAGPARRYRRLSRRMLGSASPADGAPSSPREVRRPHPPGLPALRREHGHGARALSRLPGGGVARAEHAHRGSGRRKPGHRAMGLRSLLQSAAADAASTTSCCRARSTSRRSGRGSTPRLPGRRPSAPASGSSAPGPEKSGP